MTHQRLGIPSIFRNWDTPKNGLQLPVWIEIWLGISAILCTLDVGYTMLRPLTNRGGALECVYELWNWYADIDLRYGTPNDLVTMATGRVMIIEIVMNIVAMVLNRTGSKHTFICAFTTNAFVFWKTVLYMALYINPAPGNISYINPTASLFDQIVYFWIPDLFWVLVPLVVLIRLWPELTVYPQGQLPVRTDEH
uniref:EXPERA domain-containing protein n=1 Tax=Panagrellus redivivus TaxID=6233 RepID=A0A7E4VIY4_PANRE